MEKELDLAEDLLMGVNHIVEFLGPRWTARKVYHLVEQNSLPVIRLPGSKVIYARKSQLRLAFSGQPAHEYRGGRVMERG